MSLRVSPENYWKYELECPHCRTWHSMAALPVVKVWCEDCNDDHTGFRCPTCEEAFNYAGSGYNANWRNKQESNT